MLDRLGLASRFVDGHRVTSPEAAEVAEMVLSGTTNRALAAALSRSGVCAVGLAGGDAGGVLDVVPYRPGGTDLGRVGRVRSVRAAGLSRLLDAGVVPVLSSTARIDDAGPWNVNADLVAGEVAVALGADVVAFLSDVAGVLDRDGRLLRSVSVADTVRLVSEGIADGGMRPKLEAAAAAVRGGVGRAVLADGRSADGWVAAVVGAAGRHTRVEADRPAAEPVRVEGIA
jgi:acetylglutamate kinase